jgi:signal peptidase II
MFVALLVTTLALDQGSKAWARTALDLHASTTVVPGYWDWQLEANPGAAFSSFLGAKVLLMVIAAAASAFVILTASRTAPHERLKRGALAVIAGAALGNLLDRVLAGAVTDFIHWHIHDHMWPIFNVADAALVIGVALLVVAGIGKKRPRPIAAV